MSDHDKQCGAEEPEYEVIVNVIVRAADERSAVALVFDHLRDFPGEAHLIRPRRDPTARGMTTPAESVGCCLASSKEECKRPPCPCNLDYYSPAELRALNALGENA